MKFQIGKNGITENVILTLKNAYKTRKVVRISVLKSASTSKENTKKVSDELVKRLGGNFTYVIIGFTIILKRRPLVKK